jgi:transcription elongation factor SPT6
MAYAEQFIEVDAYREKTPEELLSQARMIMATELGKDPLLRKEIRELFRREGRISVLPTDKGMIKIDRHHSYYVSSDSYRPLLHPDKVMVDLQIPTP